MSETCNQQAVKRIRKEYEKVFVFNTNVTQYAKVCMNMNR